MMERRQGGEYDEGARSRELKQMWSLYRERRSDRLTSLAGKPKEERCLGWSDDV